MCPFRKWKRRFSHHFTNQIYFVLQVVGKYFLITPRHVREVNKKEKSQTKCFSKNLATIYGGRSDGFVNETLLMKVLMGHLQPRQRINGAPTNSWLGGALPRRRQSTVHTDTPSNESSSLPPSGQ